MTDATVPIVFITSATILLTPVDVVNAVVACGPTELPAMIAMPGAIAEAAMIDVVAVYQPPPMQLSNPRFSHDASGRLTQIDYDGSGRQILTYSDERLVFVELFDGFRTLRKSFAYDASGALTSISESYV